MLTTSSGALDIKDHNSSQNDLNSSQNDLNLSLNSHIINLPTKSEETTQYQIKIGCKKKDVTGEITHLLNFSDSEKQGFTNDDNSRYYSVTTKLIAVKPSRHTLAMFVPNIYLTTNQQINKGMNKNTSVFIQARHIFSAVTGANIYDGLIEPNTKAFTVNKLNRLLAVVKTRHPIFMGDNKLTNLIGGHNHA